MYATSGNLSIRENSSNEIIITASGKNKGELAASDFLILNRNTGKPSVPSNNKPSAESAIHLAIYQAFPDSGAVIHVHTPESAALSYNMRDSEPCRTIPLPNLEMLKAFGNFTENPELSFLSLYNYGDVQKIADCFSKHAHRSEVPCFIIEHHGITVWGKNVAEANKNLEATQHILQVLHYKSSYRK